MIALRQAQDIISLGLVKGAVAGLIGAGVGRGLPAGVRLAMGLPAWDPGWAVTVGTLVGLLCYLWGLGAFRGWMRWVLAQPEKESREPTSGWARYFSFDTNHKVIGVQYMVTSLLIMAVAGVYALMGRLEMAQPGMQYMGPGTYNTLVSLHGIMMLAAVLIGISGMMNYLVPLMIGARDMAFPHLNALSYWFIPPAVFLLILSLFSGGFDTGWTAYPPLSVRAPLGMQLMLLAFYLVGLSSIAGSINCGEHQPHHHHFQAARPGDEPVPHAHLCLGSYGHRLPPAYLHPVHRHGIPHGGPGAGDGHEIL